MSHFVTATDQKGTRFARRLPIASRRDLMRFAGVSLAASVADLFGMPAHLNASPNKRVTADSVLFLWLPGGVTQLESFDPKPEAPEEVRGENSAIATTLPGVMFGEVLPRLARQLSRIALIRSFSHEINDHFIAQVYALSGREVAPNQLLTEPNFGSVIHRLMGPKGDLPAYVAVPGSTRPGPPNTNLFVPGWLGQKYAPFCTFGEPWDPNFAVKEMRLPDDLNTDRLLARGTLRQRLDRIVRAFELHAQPKAMQALESEAVRLLSHANVRRAFEIRDEPDRVRDRYGRTKLGQRCLVARRLIERGARFVMVDYGYDWGDYNNLWDNHCAPVQNQPHISKMAKLPYHLPAVDQAFSAILDDMSERGLLDRTLVVYLTEFGRTPRINPLGGRDHWGAAGSIFLAGGGVRGGQVVGRTDRIGASVQTAPYSPADVLATVYHALGLSSETRLFNSRLGREMAIADGRVIAEAF